MACSLFNSGITIVIFFKIAGFSSPPI